VTQQRQATRSLAGFPEPSRFSLWSKVRLSL
jgi:hypothetical protein